MYKVSLARQHGLVPSNKDNSSNWCQYIILNIKLRSYDSCIFPIHKCLWSNRKNRDLLKTIDWVLSYLKTIGLPPKIKGLWVHQFSNFASIKWGWDLHAILIHVRNTHDNEGKKKKKSSGEIVSGISNTFIACHKNMTSYKMRQIY